MGLLAQIQQQREFFEKEDAEVAEVDAENSVAFYKRTPPHDNLRAAPRNQADGGKMLKPASRIVETPHGHSTGEPDIFRAGSRLKQDDGRERDIVGAMVFSDAEDVKTPWIRHHHFLKQYLNLHDVPRGVGLCQSRRSYLPQLV